MLRLGVLGSTIPLVVLGFFARGEISASPQLCIAAADRKLQITSAPWQAQIHVGFTEDPARATVRVQIVEGAEAADFVVTDDVAGTENNPCATDRATVFVAISSSLKTSATAIYLTRGDDADYRVYVNSRKFTAREAAALVVAAGGKGAALTTASLAGRS